MKKLIITTLLFASLINPIDTAIEEPVVAHRSDCFSEITEVSTDELETVCCVVYAEARGESMEGKMAVAEVIKNRAELWGMTPYEVVTANGQFAAPAANFDTDTYLAVQRVFNQNARVFDSPVTHFHANYVNPYWASDKTYVGTIGNHLFYC